MKYLLMLFLLISGNCFAGTDYTADANCMVALEMKADEDPLTDSSGEGNTGALKATGEPNYTTDAPNVNYDAGSYDFDGSYDHVKVVATGVSDLEPTEDFTVVGWVNRQGACSSWARVFCKSFNNGATSPYCSWALVSNYKSDTDYAVKIYTGDGAKSGTAVSLLPSTSTWVHVAIVLSRDVSDNIVITLYKDGSSVDATTTNTTTNIIYDSDSGQGDIFMGAVGSTGGSPMNMLFTEFGFFDRVLTSTEINNIMDDGLDGTQGSAVTFKPYIIIY